MIEEWKDIAGWEGYYQVSNTGLVRSVDRDITYTRADRVCTRKFSGQVLATKTNAGGYLVVHLRNATNKKEAWPLVHTLVAQNFISNIEHKPTVNHIDGDKLNNHVGNLEWSTAKEQYTHGVNAGLIIPASGFKTYSDPFKEEVKAYYETNSVSIKALGRHFRISERTAGRIAKGQWGDVRHNPESLKDKARELRKSGLTLHEIGRELGKSFSTIHNWVGNIKDG